MRGRPKALIALSDAQLKRLQAWMHGHDRSAAQALRAHIVLLCAEGMDNKKVAERLKVSEQTVSKWRRRFAASGLEGLADAPRSGAPRSIPKGRVEALLQRTAALASNEAATWSTRRAGAEMGLSAATVSRIWRGAGLQARDATGLLHNGRQWAECEVELLGLYLGPSLRAIVLAIVPGRNAAPACGLSGNCEAPTPEDTQARACLRQGMLLALLALELVTAESGDGPHGWNEFLRFMRKIEAELPPEFEVHALVDSSEGETPALVRRWLAERSRLHIHRPPSPAGWRVQADHLLESLIDRLPASSAHRAARQLTLRSRHYLATHAAQRRPFVWICKPLTRSPSPPAARL